MLTDLQHHILGKSAPHRLILHQHNKERQLQVNAPRSIQVAPLAADCGSSRAHNSLFLRLKSRRSTKDMTSTQQVAACPFLQSCSWQTTPPLTLLISSHTLYPLSAFKKHANMGNAHEPARTPLVPFSAVAVSLNKRWRYSTGSCTANLTLQTEGCTFILKSVQMTYLINFFQLLSLLSF